MVPSAIHVLPTLAPPQEGTLEVEPEVALMQRLIDRTFTEFPADMDWPLVAAAAVQQGRDDLLPITTNVMQLDREPVHAEELLLEQVGDRSDFEIAVTMEPCGPQDRRTGDQVSCSTRIVNFATTQSVARVIVGMFRNGSGLRKLVRAGIEVVLLYGEDHQAHISTKKGTILEIVEGINRQAIRSGTGASVRIIQPVQLDRLNQESYLRLKRAEEERVTRLEEIVAWFETHARLSSEEFFDKLLADHGTFFTEADREGYLNALQGEWRNEAGSVDTLLCGGQIASRVNYTLRQARKQRVKAEIERRSGQ